MVIITSLKLVDVRSVHGGRDCDRSSCGEGGGDALAQAAPLKSVPGENLSEKLNQSNGVIRPKEVDPAIEKPAPNARDPNVVLPPGTSGGAPAPFLRLAEAEERIRPKAAIRNQTGK